MLHHTLPETKNYICFRTFGMHMPQFFLLVMRGHSTTLMDGSMLDGYYTSVVTCSRDEYNSQVSSGIDRLG